MDRADLDKGLMLPGDPLGLGPGPHETCAIPALTSADLDRLELDHIGDGLVWSREQLEPIALIGTPGMKQLGPTWKDALTAAVVLFLDHRSYPPQVVAWDGNPHRGLVVLAASLDELS